MEIELYQAEKIELSLNKNSLIKLLLFVFLSNLLLLIVNNYLIVTSLLNIIT